MQLKALAGDAGVGAEPEVERKVRRDDVPPAGQAMAAEAPDLVCARVGTIVDLSGDETHS